MSPRAERLVAAAGTLVGAVMLAAPDRALTALGLDPDLPGVRTATRVLGARHIAQGALLAVLPGRVPRALVVVDALHAASMAALAAWAPAYRRAAVTSAVGAVASGAVTLRVARGAG